MRAARLGCMRKAVGQRYGRLVLPIANDGGQAMANPPPDGDYSSSYTWYLYDPTATNVVSTDWNMYPNGPHGLTTDYTTTGWIDGLFVVRVASSPRTTIHGIGRRPRRLSR